jgi:hypothetical protein
VNGTALFEGELIAQNSNSGSVAIDDDPWLEATTEYTFFCAARGIHVVVGLWAVEKGCWCGEEMNEKESTTPS